MEDVLTIGIAVAAFALSLTTFLHQRSSTERDLLVRVFEDFLSPHQQAGRRALFAAESTGRLAADLTEDEWHSINHALASFNLIGYLHYREAIPREDAAQLFGLSALRSRESAEAIGFLSTRDHQQGTAVWPYFRRFTSDFAKNQERTIKRREKLLG